MGKKLSFLTVLFLFFFLVSRIVEVQGKAWVCPVAEQSEGNDFHKEAEYWTVSTTYLFFTYDYIVPFSLAVSSDSDLVCAMYAFTAEKNTCCADDGTRSAPLLSHFLMPPGNCTGRDYYVLALHHIVV